MRIKHLRWIMIPDERRICIGRFYFDDDMVKLSVSLVWEPRDLWVGVYWDRPSRESLFLYVCLLPLVPIRIHWKRSFGGRFG